MYLQGALAEPQLALVVQQQPAATTAVPMLNTQSPAPQAVSQQPHQPQQPQAQAPVSQPMAQEASRPPPQPQPGYSNGTGAER